MKPEVQYLEHVFTLIRERTEYNGKRSCDEQLREGEIAIYTRDYGVRQGFFDIDPRPFKVMIYM